MNFEVLSGFDFERWKPRLVLLEDHVSSLDKHRFMTRAGYALMRRSGLNGWYVPRADAPPMNLLGRWQIVRKYYLALPFRMFRDCQAATARPHPVPARGCVHDAVRLSAIVIAKNEARNIEACLDSLAFCDRAHRGGWR